MWFIGILMLFIGLPVAYGFFIVSGDLRRMSKMTKPEPEPVIADVEFVSFDIINEDEYTSSNKRYKRIEATAKVNDVFIRMTLRGVGQSHLPLDINGFVGPNSDLDIVVIEIGDGEKWIPAPIGAPEIRQVFEAVWGHLRKLKNEIRYEEVRNNKAFRDAQQDLLKRMIGKPLPPETALSRVEGPVESAEKGLSLTFDA